MYVEDTKDSNTVYRLDTSSYDGDRETEMMDHIVDEDFIQ